MQTVRLPPTALFPEKAMSETLLIKGATVITLDDENHVFDGDVFVENGRIGALGASLTGSAHKGDEVPAGLREETEASIAESLALLERWHGEAEGRIRYCFAPRFAISCTQELLKRVGRLSRERGVMIHTHASENRDEIELVERETGRRNIEYLNDVGLAAPNVVLAHCVHLDSEEMEVLSRTGTHVAHCPSSNLKLGSGLAPVFEMLERGISVSLGADGAPCNNR